MPLKDRVRGWLSHDAHPFIQFIKYGIAGGLATVVDVVVFFLLAWQFIPALTSGDPLVKLLGIAVTPVSEAARGTNYVIDKSLTFLVSNLVAYLANILFVFKPGRHSRLVEFLLFYLVSGISFALGTGLGWALVHYGHFSTTIAFLANLIAALAINYVCRKFLIFKG